MRVTPLKCPKKLVNQVMSALASEPHGDDTCVLGGESI